MAHRTGTAVFQSKNYFARYGEDAIDLCDVLASFDARSKASLDITCKAMGLKGKASAISGANVAEYVASGKIREVAEYCESDVLNTYRLWLRYELFRGMLSLDEFEASEQNLSLYVSERLPSKSHLLELVVARP